MSHCYRLRMPLEGKEKNSMTPHEIAVDPMKGSMRILVLLMLFSLLISACSRDAADDVPEEFLPKKMTVLYFNDFHGHLLPFKRFYGDKKLSGGFSYLSALVKKIRAENDQIGIDTLVLSSGDNFQGTPLSTAFRGKVEIKAYNLLGLDASAVGNHDFDFGSDDLFDLRYQANFPMLSANVYDAKSSELSFLPFEVIEMGSGLRVGIIGLSTPETPITTHPLNVESLRFTRPELALQQYLHIIDEETDLIVVLSHLGEETDRNIARQYPGLDIILGGHTHTLLADPITIGDVMICQAGDRGLFLGRLELEVKDDRSYLISNRLIPITPELENDKEMSELIDSYQQKLSSEISRVVGRSEVFLDGERATIRTGETNLGNFTADLMRLRTDSDVALINAGAIRASMPPGLITIEHVMRTFPMNNQIETVEVSGKQLFLVLQRSVKGLLASSPSDLYGGFLQVSGLSFRIRGRQITDVRIKGKPLQLYQVYKVATGDFLAAGGDGYKELKEGENHYKTGVTLQDLLLDFLEKHQSIKAGIGQRIIRE